MMTKTRDIYGQRICVRTDDPVIALGAEDVLGPFPIAAASGDGPTLDISMFAVGSQAEIPYQRTASTIVVGEMPRRDIGLRGTLLRDGKRWIIDCGIALIVLDPANSRAEGWLVQPDKQVAEFSAVFVLIAIIELLRSRDIYAVHCSALAKNGRGILFIGAGGSGKTTACVSLTRAGYHCLSDDHPLLREHEGRLEMLAFPGRLSVADRTVEFFPELSAAQDRLRPGWRKRSFSLSDIEGYSGGESCRPELLIFPRIADRDESVFEPMPRAQALQELLPQSLLVMDPVLAARQFKTISRLAQETPAYRLHFGRDVEHLPRLIDGLLASSRAQATA